MDQRNDAGAPADRMDVPAKPAAREAMKKLRTAMSSGCALNRSEESLIEVLEAIAELHATEPMTSGLKSALVSAELIAQGALAREESRGAHFRSDFPETDEEAFHTEIAAETDDFE
jgi:L-aspartate oxidase